MKSSLTVSILIILVFPFAVGQPQAGLPDTPVGKHVEAYLKAFSSPDQGLMRSFFQERTARSSLADVPVEQRLSRFSQMKQRLESLRLKRVVSSTSQSVTILATAKSGATVQLSFEFEPQPPYGLLGIRVEDLGEPDEEGFSAGRKANDAELVGATRSFLDSLSKADEFSGVVLLAKRGKELGGIRLVGEYRPPVLALERRHDGMPGGISIRRFRDDDGVVACLPGGGRRRRDGRA